MKILEHECRLPIAWEIKLLEETFAGLQKAFERNLKKKEGKDVFDLGPHLRTIQETMFPEKRLHHLGFPVNTFQSAMQDMKEVIELDDAEKILAYKQDIIDIATWFYYNQPPTVTQKDVMIAS